MRLGPDQDNAILFFIYLLSVSGGELFERVIDESFDLTEKEVTFFMRQICEGVKFMHAQKVLHLDMKVRKLYSNCLTQRISTKN
jgi:myosin-light-chain kinase